MYSLQVIYALQVMYSLQISATLFHDHFQMPRPVFTTKYCRKVKHGLSSLVFFKHSVLMVKAVDKVVYYDVRI